MLCCTALKTFLDSYLYPAQLTAYDKWIAQYAGKCTCKHPYGIWQYTGSGRVNGIVGDVDKDIAYKDYPSIIAKMEQPQADKNCCTPYRWGRLHRQKAPPTCTPSSMIWGISYFSKTTPLQKYVSANLRHKKKTKTAGDLKKKGFGGFVNMI